MSIRIGNKTIAGMPDISGKQDKLTAGTGIEITEDNVINNTQTSAEWGNITGTLVDQTDLKEALQTKQDTLVSGTNIKTINNESILGSGNITIEGGGSDIIALTKAEYDALETKEEDKYYAITDDASSSGGGSTGGATRPLFEHTILDYVTTDSSYGMADLNEWYTKANYSKAYNKLVDEYENGELNLSSCTKIGSPTITDDFVVSGFSENDYLQTKSNFTPGNSTWELQFKVTMGSSVASGGKAICEQYFSSTYYSGICLMLEGNILCLRIGNGSSHIITVRSSYTFNANTTYYVNVSFTGTSYILKASTNGTTWTTVNTTSSSTKMSGEYPLRIGRRNAPNNENTISRWQGSIDLKECYIKINNQLWWSGAWGYKTSDGLKVADNQYADNVNAEYTSNNKAWYYLLDQTNERFKLPRSKTLLDDMDSKTGTTNHLYFYLGGN